MQTFSQSDFDEVVDLAVKQYQDSVFYEIREVKPDVIRQSLEACISNGVVIIEKVDNKVVGFIAALLLDHHPVIGECRLAAEIGLFVDRNHRNKGIAKSLNEKFEEWCGRVGVTHSMTSAMFNENFEQVKSLYEKRGYKMVEASFIKEIQ
jgi:GNAT superfamily N-acetyltransferase